MFIEFSSATYSVVEDDRLYSVTVVRQGEPGENITVSIFLEVDSTSPDPVECKRMPM